jgi:hypothetical protein
LLNVFRAGLCSCDGVCGPGCLMPWRLFPLRRFCFGEAEPLMGCPLRLGELTDAALRELSDALPLVLLCRRLRVLVVLSLPLPRRLVDTAVAG